MYFNYCIVFPVCQSHLIKMKIILQNHCQIKAMHGCVSLDLKFYAITVGNSCSYLFQILCGWF